MAAIKPTMKMPELLVFAKLFVVGFVGAEFFSGRDEDGYIQTKAGFPGGLDPEAMGRYWRQYRERIRALDCQTSQRCVFTPNYVDSSRRDLDGVFTVLDELANEPPAHEAEVAV